jgi:dynein heavy chain
MLDSVRNKSLHHELPVLHLVPTKTSLLAKEGFYQCPLYNVISRGGSIGTDRNESNFLMYIDLPTLRSNDFWIRSGVAAFLSLNY